MNGVDELDGISFDTDKRTLSAANIPEQKNGLIGSPWLK